MKMYDDWNAGDLRALTLLNPNVFTAALISRSGREASEPQ
jgi:hypothetical protein